MRIILSLLFSTFFCSLASGVDYEVTAASTSVYHGDEILAQLPRGSQFASEYANVEWVLAENILVHGGYVTGWVSRSTVREIVQGEPAKPIATTKKKKPGFFKRIGMGIDKGLGKLAGTISEKDRITGKSSLGMQERDEQIRAGNKAALKKIKALKQHKVPLNNEADPEQYSRFIKIFNEVHSVSHLSNETWTVVLIGDSKWNAFVTGGTYMFLHLGLLQDVTDDELAAVIGHEIAHVAANHIFERQGQNFALGATGSTSARTGAYQAAFTHESEEEADKVGIVYMALAGYDPMAAYGLWNRKYNAGETRRGNYVQNHPIAKERASAAYEVASLSRQYYTHRQINLHSATLVHNNAVYAKEGIQRKRGKGGGFLRLLETAGNTYGQHMQNKNEVARQHQQNQFVAAVKRYMKYYGAERPALNTVRVYYQWGGNIPLSAVTIAVQVRPDRGGKAIVLKNLFREKIMPGSKHYFDFTDNRLTRFNWNARNVASGIQDAER